MTFMNFCLTFCPPEEIECTIALRQNLQVQVCLRSCGLWVTSSIFRIKLFISLRIHYSKFQVSSLLFFIDCSRFLNPFQSLFNGCVEKTSVISTRGRGKLSGLADTGGATTVVKGLMDKGMQGIVKSAGAMQQLIKTRYASLHLWWIWIACTTFVTIYICAFIMYRTTGNLASQAWHWRCLHRKTLIWRVLNLAINGHNCQIKMKALRVLMPSSVEALKLYHMKLTLAQ